MSGCTDNSAWQKPGFFKKPGFSYWEDTANRLKDSPATHRTMAERLKAEKCSTVLIFLPFLRTHGRFPAFVSVGAVNAEMTARSFKCRKCRKPCPIHERMKLWDGRAYCTVCVRAFSPRLAEYAAAHPRWKESAPWPWRPGALWRKALPIQLGVFLLIASFLGRRGAGSICATKFTARKDRSSPTSPGKPPSRPSPRNRRAT